MRLEYHSPIVYNQKMNTKTCARCKKILPVSDFYAYESRCKKCVSAYGIAWRKKNPDYHKNMYHGSDKAADVRRRRAEDAIKLPSMDKVCSKCKKKLPLSSFGKSRSQCKDCLSVTRKKRRDSNPATIARREAKASNLIARQEAREDEKKAKRLEKAVEIERKFQREVGFRVKTCSVCNVEKSWDDFYKSKDCKHGIYSSCITCTRKRVAIWTKKQEPGSLTAKQIVLNNKWRKNNPEKYKEQRKRHRSTPHSKARRKMAAIRRDAKALGCSHEFIPVEFEQGMYEA